MIDASSRWARTSPAQDFVSNMMNKLDEMILAAYTCMDKDTTDKDSVRDLIVSAEGIMKEQEAMENFVFPDNLQGMLIFCQMA